MELIKQRLTLYWEAAIETMQAINAQIVAAMIALSTHNTQMLEPNYVDKVQH